MNRRTRWAAAVAAALAATLLTPAAAAGAPDTGRDCRTVRVPVALHSGQPATHHIEGTLCDPASGPSKTIQLLVHGFFYSRSYWDFPYRPEIYSYTKRANNAGYSTFAVDRIGIGASSHPPATDVNVATNSYTLHQITTALRNGTADGTRHEQVIGVGHSLGGLLVLDQAGKYHDLDAIISTGFVYSAAPRLAVTVAQLIPTPLDPELGKQNYPLGYLTTAPGSRTGAFYHREQTDPAVLDIDERTKQTGTLPEVTTGATALLTGALGLGPSTRIQVPVLFVVGNQDHVVCGTFDLCQNETQVINAEKPSLPNAPCISAIVTPNAGHSMNLEKTAPTTTNTTLQWMNTHTPPQAAPRCS